MLEECRVESEHDIDVGQHAILRCNAIIAEVQTHLRGLSRVTIFANTEDSNPTLLLDASVKAVPSLGGVLSVFPKMVRVAVADSTSEVWQLAAQSLPTKPETVFETKDSILLQSNEIYDAVIMPAACGWLADSLGNSSSREQDASAQYLQGWATTAAESASSNARTILSDTSFDPVGWSLPILGSPGESMATACNREAIQLRVLQVQPGRYALFSSEGLSLQSM